MTILARYASGGCGVLGSIGTNVLIDLATKVIDGLRAGGRQPSPNAVEQALATRIEEAFADPGEPAKQLREQTAARLREIDAAKSTRWALHWILSRRTIRSCRQHWRAPSRR